MKPTREEVIQTLRTLLPSFASRYGVERMGLFGSYVRGEADDESDLDVLIEGGKYSLFDLIGMEEELSKHFHVKVDLVNIEGLKPRIKPRILKEVLYA